MSTITTKLICECDYVVYADDKANIMGYELSPDERQGLDVRFNAKNQEEYPTIPDKATHLIEIFGITTVIVWVKDTETGKGELLFYRPMFQELAKDIAKFGDQAVPLKQDADKTICGFPIASDNWLPKIYLTKQWMEVWKAHPEVQGRMVAFQETLKAIPLLTNRGTKDQKKVDEETEKLLKEGKL